ncbi:Uncharacterized protein PBTT_03893 [Plasmodiophora brassicae]
MAALRLLIKAMGTVELVAAVTLSVMYAAYPASSSQNPHLYFAIGAIITAASGIITCLAGTSRTRSIALVAVLSRTIVFAIAVGALIIAPSLALAAVAVAQFLIIYAVWRLSGLVRHPQDFLDDHLPSSQSSPEVDYQI